MEYMNPPQDISRPQRFGQVAGVLGLAVLTILGATYLTNRLRKLQQTQQLLDTLPAAIEARAGESVVDMEHSAAAHAPAAVTGEVAPAATCGAGVLEEKTVEELYQMARDRDIAGRSNMRKAELIVALQASDEKAS